MRPLFHKAMYMYTDTHIDICVATVYIQVHVYVYIYNDIYGMHRLAAVIKNQIKFMNPLMTAYL